MGMPAEVFPLVKTGGLADSDEHIFFHGATESDVAESLRLGRAVRISEFDLDQFLNEARLR